MALEAKVGQMLMAGVDGLEVTDDAQFVIGELRVGNVVLMGRNVDSPPQVLGLTQGLYCLGCCWAMMLLMFAVGVMNVVWMAGLGIVMTVEKMVSGPRFSRAVGAILIVIGVATLAVSVAGNWPVSAN